jgi:hypothetical protein
MERDVRAWYRLFRPGKIAHQLRAATPRNSYHNSREDHCETARFEASSVGERNLD